MNHQENGHLSITGSPSSTTSSSRFESRRIKTNYKGYTPKQAKNIPVLTPRKRKEIHQSMKQSVPTADEDDGEFQTEEQMDSLEERLPEEVEVDQFFIVPKNHNKISAYQDKYLIRFSTPGTTNHTSVMVNSKFDIRGDEHRVFYFEIDVIRSVKNVSIAIGFSSKDGYYHAFPGFDDISYAYHGDTGSISHDSKFFEINKPFAVGDTAGAGILLPQRHVFFTLNGEFLGKFYDLSSLEENVRIREEAKLTEAADIEHIPYTFTKYIYVPGHGIYKGTWEERQGEHLSGSTTDGLPNEARRHLVIREKRGKTLDQKLIEEYLNMNPKSETIMEPEYENPFIFYPVIGSNAPCTVTTNFGQTPFKFDISTINTVDPIPLREEVITSSFAFDDTLISPSKSEPFDIAMECVQSLNIEKIESFFSKYGFTDINKVSDRGQSLLHLACGLQAQPEVTTQIINCLLEKGADVNLYTQTLGCPLHVACKNGNVMAVNILTKHKSIDLNILHKKKTACDFAYYVPEMRYVQIVQEEVKNRLEIIKNLRDLGSKMNLHTAVFYGDFEKVRYLIEVEGEYVDCQDEFYRTSLHIASAMGYEDIAEYLLDKNACPNFGNFVPPPLLIAAECMNPGMVRVLAKNRAEVNIYTVDGKHILEYLMGKHEKYEDPEKEEKFEKTIEALCESGSDPCLVYGSTTGSRGQSKCALLIALDRLDFKMFAIFARNSKYIIRIRGEYDETVLHLICNCIFYNIEEEKILYDMAVILVKELCVDITAKDENGNTALHLAAGSGMTNIIRLLLLYGAEIDVVNYDGYPPLFIALYNKQFQAAKYLVKNGSKANFELSNGQTILHLMYDLKGRKNHLYMEELSLEEIQLIAGFCINTLGVKENTIDKDRLTMRDYATKNSILKYYPIVRPERQLK